MLTLSRHKMVNHTQTIRQLLPNCLNVFDHFVELVFKGLTLSYLMLKHGQAYFKNLAM